METSRRQWIYAWLMLSPAMALLILFTHYPAVQTILNSFYSTPRGRRKAVWVSKSATLLEDAKRDWSDLGGAPTDIHALSRWSADEDIKLQHGILFVTYATLRAASQKGRTRLEQVLNWLGAHCTTRQHESVAQRCHPCPLHPAVGLPYSTLGTTAQHAWRQGYSTAHKRRDVG